MDDEIKAHLIMILFILISASISMVGLYFLNLTNNILIGILAGLSFAIGTGSFFFFMILYLAMLESG